MARRNESMMKKRFILSTVVSVLASIGSLAQSDSYLMKLTEGVVEIRKSKSSKEKLNHMVAQWSATDSPKITLMDEMNNDTEHEFRGSGTNKFQMNKVVTFVYGNQNTNMVSKGDYFNSTEKDVFYSAIEKTVKKKQTVTYTLTGHIGIQEFVFVSYDPKTVFTATVNGEKAIPIGEGIQYLKIGKVGENDEIVFSIKNESSSNESFVILNHNPQQ